MEPTPLKDLPQEVQNDFKVACYFLSKQDTKNGRDALRAVIHHHTNHGIEVCEEIQSAYGKLLGLEALEALKADAQKNLNNGGTSAQ